MADDQDFVRKFWRSTTNSTSVMDRMRASVPPDTPRTRTPLVLHNAPALHLRISTKKRQSHSSSPAQLCRAIRRRRRTCPPRPSPTWRRRPAPHAWLLCGSHHHPASRPHLVPRPHPPRPSQKGRHRRDAPRLGRPVPAPLSTSLVDRKGRHGPVPAPGCRLGR
jgi:hypothetical protein